MNDAFDAWLRSGDQSLLRLAFSRETYFFLRAAKRPGFDYLYCQRQFREDGLRRGDSFKYVGLYCHADGQIYDAEYTLSSIKEMDAPFSEHNSVNLLGQLKQDVRTMVEQQISNERQNLTVQTLADPQNISALESYRQYAASLEARGAYLENRELDVGFHCRYSPEAWTEESLLDYISDPLTYAEHEMARYLAEEQEEMLLQFLKADALAEAYQSMIAVPEHPVHTLRTIMTAMRDSPAKTVTVTIFKDGKEFSFKTEAADLRRDCGNHYNSWNIAAADRRAFAERFGRNADYAPEEILRVTYGKRTLYKKPAQDT